MSSYPRPETTFSSMVGQSSRLGFNMLTLSPVSVRTIGVRCGTFTDKTPFINIKFTFCYYVCSCWLYIMPLCVSFHLKAHIPFTIFNFSITMRWRRILVLALPLLAFGTTYNVTIMFTSLCRSCSRVSHLHMIMFHHSSALGVPLFALLCHFHRIVHVNNRHRHLCANNVVCRFVSCTSRIMYYHHHLVDVLPIL